MIGEIRNPLPLAITSQSKKKQHIPPPAIFFPPRNTPPIIHTSYFHRYQILDTRSLKLHCVKFAQFPPVFRVLCQNNTEFPLLSAGVSNLHKFLLFSCLFGGFLLNCRNFYEFCKNLNFFSKSALLGTFIAIYIV